MTLDELLEQLKKLEYTWTGFGEKNTSKVIAREGYDRVEQLIRQFALDNHDEELGVLQAKVYAYEQIIANSNFAPMLIKPEEAVVDIGRLAEQVVGYGESEGKQ